MSWTILVAVKPSLANSSDASAAINYRADETMRTLSNVGIVRCALCTLASPRADRRQRNSGRPEITRIRAPVLAFSSVTEFSNELGTQTWSPLTAMASGA